MWGELIAVPFQKLVPSLSAAGGRDADVLALAWQEKDAQAVNYSLAAGHH